MYLTQRQWMKRPTERVRRNQDVLKCAVSLAKVYAPINDCIRNLMWAIWNLWQRGGDVNEWKIKCRPIRTREIGGISLSDVRLTIKVRKTRPRQRRTTCDIEKLESMSRTETDQKTTVLYILFSLWRFTVTDILK